MAGGGEKIECPECGSANLIKDHNTGEIICGTCGFVLSDVEFAPPPERIPKIERPNYHGLTSFSLGTASPSMVGTVTGTKRVLDGLSSLQRTESNIVQDIDRIVSNIALPNIVKLIAVVRARKFLRLMREQKNSKTRLTGKEIAVISVWDAIKITDKPITINEYAEKIHAVFPNYTAGDILKLQNRAINFAKVTTRMPDPVNYVKSIILKLEGEVEGDYLNLVGRYAIQMIKKNSWIAENRKPTLVASAALKAADDLLGRKISLQKLSKLSGTGVASITNLATYFKKYAPPIPPKGALFRFRSFWERKVKNIGES